MNTRLVLTGRTTWHIAGESGWLGELRKIKRLFVLVPTAGSSLDDVKNGYGSQPGAMRAITACTGGVCKMMRR